MVITSYTHIMSVKFVFDHKKKKMHRKKLKKKKLSKEKDKSCFS